MRQLFFEFLDRKVAAVRLGKREPVVLYVITVSALDLFDVRTAACDHGNHVDPEDILHAAARHRAVMFFGERIDFVCKRRRRRPRINGFLARGDHIDPAQHAFFDRFIDISHKAEQRDDGNVCIALVKHLVRVIRDHNARLDAELRIVPHVHAKDCGIDVDRSDDLRTLLMQIAQNVFAHFAASVLHHSDPFHNNTPYLLLNQVFPRLTQIIPAATAFVNGGFAKIL